jgi:hypothetical protein
MVFQTFERMKITASVNFASNLAKVCAAVWMLAQFRHVNAFQWAVTSLIVSALTASASVASVTICYGWPTFSFFISAHDQRDT